MPQKRRSLIVLPVIVLLCALAGGFYGPRIQVAAAASEGEDLPKDVESFTKAYAQVEQNFADPVDADKAIYKGAIPGMLRTLDPHSNFFDPKEYQALREDQKGHYYGVGMQVGPRNGKTVVMAPFPGSPAYKAGLRPGDIIIKVNDKHTENLSTTEIADLLKGPRGTQVTITVSREGTADPVVFTVTRDEIKRNSVQDAFWVKPGIAFMKIESFNETTSREMEDNLKRLGENNIKGLILDLRENPGGLLNEGVAVADHFLQKGQTIVSHHGRNSPEKTYVARNGNHGHDYPIVVLVNRYSASAAEIVTGALQDHDRAWVLGETTFGKGLVQTVYPLSENTGLALTTAHFYTPSGRLIQRDYSHKSFYDYYFHKDDNARNPLDVKMTDAGRTVYGGGGITPDQKYETPKLDRFETDLIRKGAFFNYTRTYFGSHDTHLPKGWMPDEAFLTEFHDYLLKENYKFTESEFTQDHDWVRRYLAREIYITAFNLDESYRVFNQTDPEVQLAVDAMPKAEALLQSAKKIIVQRLSSQTHTAELARH
ncbi:MAG TPA: S41 family peptidase [Bryobacteraceae bacterium]|nr:S41 family peptidase [Bryobacteraceae bacterium]